MEDLPTLIVPDDPETGAIERPKTPPPVQIDQTRLVNTVVTYSPPALNLEGLPNAVIAPETYVAVPGSKQPTPRPPTVRDEHPSPGSTHATPRPPTTRDEQPAVDPTPLTELLVISDGAELGTADVEQPLSARAAALNSKDYKAMAKRAAAAAKLDRLAGGNKSVFDANMRDIAELGIGMQLYFLLLKYLGGAFLIMGIVSLPAIVVNYYGNGVTSKMVDPLLLAYASLGNQGVNPDIASDPTQCLPVGDIDCTGATVNTPFTSDPATVAWIVTGSDAIYSFLFLIIYLAFRRHAKRAIETHQNEHLTPAKYAIFVRGLPPNATAREVLEHFNSRYDPTQEESYIPLWLGCCWGRRPRRVKHSLSKGAVNCNVVRSLDHLARVDSAVKAGTSPTKDSIERKEEQQMYLGTWVAEVSIAHPTGGLLRTFLAMEALTRRISDAQELIGILEQEKQQAELVLQNYTPAPGKKRAKKPKSTFKPADELLLQHAIKQLERLQTAMTKKTSKLKALKQTQQADAAAAVGVEGSTTKENSKAAQTRTRRQAASEDKPFDLTACECAFVVFNNLESRRRCLQDYRHSDRGLTRRFQPKSLRFRDGKHALKVLPAPEPSNILWENLEVTPRSRRLRRGLTNFVTFLLLLVSGAIISAAQSAQQTFKDKAPPAGLCDTALPEIFYASPNFTKSSPKLSWDLEWNPNATCTPGDTGDTRYHIAYSNNVVNTIHVRNPAVNVSELHRCVDPCVSESSSTTCYTLPCFDGVARIETGEQCETYQASHMLYCLCTTKLQESIDTLGLISGPRQLWQTYVPCRTFLTDYLAKNVFIVLASVVVVVVNMVLKTTLRGFASLERHTSESAKTSAVALKMFAAQFLNTAIIVLVVNAALSLSSVPVAGELFRGKFADFQRDWYPTVGMGITMTMLINAVVPQLLLLLQLCVLNPLQRCLTRRHIRTQAKMNQLYAGPTFDLAVRYPMVLNSVCVTFIFCGGSPVLLFIAALACAGIFWLDKLALVWQYNVKTAYDEELGETVLGLLPWTLVAHLAFSSWMYGNTDLLQAPTLKLGWLLDLFGVSTDGAASTDALYAQVLAKAAKKDPLGQHGFVVKVLHANVMLMFMLFVLVMLGILLSTLWARVLLPVLRHTLGRVLVALWRRLRPLFRFCRCCFRRSSNSVKPQPSPVEKAVQPAGPDTAKPPSGGRSAKVAADIILTDLSTSETVTLPQADDVVSPATGNGKEDGDAAAEHLVQKSAGVPALSTARKPQPAAAEALTLEQTPTPTVPVSSRSAPAEIILPEFTDFFRKSVGPTFRPDKKLGFKRDSSRPSELVRQYQQETVSNGVKRKSGEPMRTWEAMQAPVKTYAIEANAKYRLAVAELVAASKRALVSPETIAEKAESPKKPEGVVDVGVIVPASQNAPAIDAAATDLVVTEVSPPPAEAPVVLG